MIKSFAYRDCIAYNTADWDGAAHFVGLIIPNEGISLRRAAHYWRENSEQEKDLFRNWHVESIEKFFEHYNSLLKILKGEKEPIVDEKSCNEAHAFGDVKEIELNKADIELPVSDSKIPLDLQKRLSIIVNNLYSLV